MGPGRKYNLIIIITATIDYQSHRGGTWSIQIDVIMWHKIENIYLRFVPDHNHTLAFTSICIFTTPLIKKYKLEHTYTKVLYLLRMNHSATKNLCARKHRTIARLVVEISRGHDHKPTCEYFFRLLWALISVWIRRLRLGINSNRKLKQQITYTDLYRRIRIIPSILGHKTPLVRLGDLIFWKNKINNTNKAGPYNKSATWYADQVLCQQQRPLYKLKYRCPTQLPETTATVANCTAKTAEEN